MMSFPHSMHANKQNRNTINSSGAGKPFVSYFGLQRMEPNLGGWSALSKVLKALSRLLL